MKILFAFENSLPSSEADAEVFVTTARYLAPGLAQSWLHVPLADDARRDVLAASLGLAVVRAAAPLRPAALRHLCCGLTLVFRRAFREADLVYTRNLWVAWMALLFGQAVAFDHYRPWPDQIPPLQLWIYRLMRRRRFLINICHSEYTLGKYRALGVAAEKLECVHNGFEPARLRPWMTPDAAKRAIGVAEGQKTVVYTGRLNHKKGLELVVAAARQLPELLFILVGSYGEGPIEALAAGQSNIRIVPFQTQDALRPYIFAADVLLIPPSWKPLAEFGSTVLPLKLFLYMASGRPILAGNTPDVREVLRHGENAFLCAADQIQALVDGLVALTGDEAMAARLGRAAQAESEALTWQARADRIGVILRRRLAAAPAVRGRWTAAQYGAWLGRSGRWLAHLVRARSFVLPPHG